MKFSDKIERELFLPVPVTQVWEAIATAEGLGHWFSNQVSLDLQVGGAIKFTWNDHGTSNGRIERLDPPNVFAYRWQAHTVPDDEPLTPANSTVVTFSLTEVDNGTQLSVVETGFAGLETAVREQNFQENTTGWRVELQELVDYLTGEPA